MEIQMKGTCERINGTVTVRLELGPPICGGHSITYGNHLTHLSDEQLIMMTTSAYQKALQETFGVQVQAKRQ